MQHRVHKIGLDANQPINHQGHIAARLKDPEIIAGTNASWVRINFVLGPHASPTQQEWRRTYDTIINQYLDRGMNIFGLIGHESVRSPLGLPDFFRDPRGSASDSRADEWINDYVQNFAAIVEHFYPRVKVFESFNEPDDYHGQNRNWIHPTWFAVMLTRIYDRIKGDPRFRNATLVSGPLQGMSINNNAPVNYLSNTYQYGEDALGWGKANRPYPFDGVGYHLYIHEEYNPNWQQHEAAVRRTYRDFTGAIHRVIRQFEGKDRHLHISETGWPSAADNQEAKKFQAKHASLILELMNKDPAVAIGIWFCTEDFEPREKFYGLYERGRPTPQGRKPVYFTYQTFCEKLLKEEEKKKEKEKEKEKMATIKQQIVQLQGQLATRLREYGQPVPSPSGNLRQQVNQLRRQIISLRPDFAAPLNAITDNSLSQQLVEFTNYVNQIPPKLTILEPGRPPGPAPQPTSLKAQIEALQSKLATLLQQSGRPVPAVSGTMRQQIDQLRQQIISLRPDFGPQLNALAGSPLTQQVTQLNSYVDQISLPPPITVEPPQGQGTISQQLAQLRSQLADLERRLPDGSSQFALSSQVETLNTRVTQMQQYIQQLMVTQAQLQDDLQALQAQVSTLGPVTTPGQGPVERQITPPSIQDISNQLPRHPTKQFAQRSLDKIRYIIIQHSGNDARYGAAPIANYLVNRPEQPWAGIPYHYFITDQGVIQQTNQLTISTSHEAVVIIGFAGKFTTTTPTPQQIEAGAQLSAWLLTQFRLSPSAMRGAKEISATESPGAQWDSGARWGDQLRNRIQAYL